jgi:hypothetical protein
MSSCVHMCGWNHACDLRTSSSRCELSPASKRAPGSTAHPRIALPQPTQVHSSSSHLQSTPPAMDTTKSALGMETTTQKVLQLEPALPLDRAPAAHCAGGSTTSCSCGGAHVCRSCWLAVSARVSHAGRLLGATGARGELHAWRSCNNYSLHVPRLPLRLRLQAMELMRVRPRSCACVLPCVGCAGVPARGSQGCCAHRHSAGLQHGVRGEAGSRAHDACSDV